MSCPLMALNYADLSLDADHSLDFLFYLIYKRASRFVVFQTKVVRSCFCLVRIKMPLLICGGMVVNSFSLGPAETYNRSYVLRGTLRTYAIKNRAVTDNQTIKKSPRKGNRGPVRGTDGPVLGAEGPLTGTGPLLIAQNPF